MIGGVYLRLLVFAIHSIIAKACSADGTENLGGCCGGVMCNEDRPSTDPAFCSKADPQHDISCWSGIVMCRTACQDLHQGYGNQFMLGALHSPDCPILYETISDDAGCEKAAQSLGLSWDPGTTAAWCPSRRPGGCFLHTLSGKVYNNDLCAGGVDDGDDKRLCILATGQWPENHCEEVRTEVVYRYQALQADHALGLGDHVPLYATSGSPEGPIAYALAEPHRELGSVPIYEYRVVLTPGPPEDDIDHDYVWDASFLDVTVPAYVYQRIAFHAFREPRPGLIPIYRYKTVSGKPYSLIHRLPPAQPCNCHSNNASLLFSRVAFYAYPSFFYSPPSFAGFLADQFSHTWVDGSLNETKISYVPLDLAENWTDPGTICVGPRPNETNETMLYPVQEVVSGNLHALGTSMIKYECACVTLSHMVTIRNRFELHGEALLTLPYSSSSWTDPWATCIDDYGSFHPVTSNSPTSIVESAPPFGSWNASIVHDIEYTCLGIRQATRRVIFRLSHMLLGNSVQYLRVCYPDDPDCNLWTDPGSDCFDFSSGTSTMIAGSLAISGIDRSTPNTETITYSGCPGAGDVTRTIIVREPIELVFGLDTRVRTGHGFWIDPDPGGNCIDAFGGFYAVTSESLDGPISLEAPGIYNITYNCRRRYTRDVVRDIEVRDGLVLNGPTQQFVLQGDTWTNPGATCITDEGDYMSDVDGNSDTVDSAIPGVYEITYSCRRRDTPNKSIQIDVLSVFELNGLAYDRVQVKDNTTYDDKYAICRGPGFVELPYTSDRRRFNLDKEELRTIEYKCNTNSGEVIITRYIEIVSPFKLRDYIHSPGFPQRVQLASSGTWIDPGADCIDADNNPVTPTSSHPSVSLATASSFTVEYECLSYPKIYRDVQIREALILVGGSYKITRTKSGQSWQDPGADCIDAQGLPVAATATHTYSGNPPSPGTAFDLTAERIYTLDYNCESKTVSRTVQVRDAIKLKGGINPSGGDYTMYVQSNPGQPWTYHSNPSALDPEVSCISDDGIELTVNKYVDDVLDGTFILDSPGKFDVVAHEAKYECDDTPNVTRLVYVRDAIRLTTPNSDPLTLTKEGDFSAPPNPVDPGVDAIDPDGNDVTNSIQTSYTDADGNTCSIGCTGGTPELSATVEGNYTVTYTIVGATQTRTVLVKKAITMAGANPKTLLVAGQFGAPSAVTDDAGVVCRAPDGSSITPSTNTNPSSIDRSVVGSHDIRYRCTYNGEKVDLWRTYDVVNALTVFGSNPMKVRSDDNAKYTEPAPIETNGHICYEPVPMDSDNLVVRAVVQNPADGTQSFANPYTFQVTYSCTCQGFPCASSADKTIISTRVVHVVSPFMVLGTNPTLVIEGSAIDWIDPGAECLKADGTFLPWTSQNCLKADGSSGGSEGNPCIVSLDQPKEVLITYSCTDTPPLADIQRRVVVTESPGTATPILVARSPTGAASLDIVVGETFNDPGACCVDIYPHLLNDATVLGVVNNMMAGPNTMVYRCIGVDNVPSTVERVVRVNEAPTVTLYGDATSRITHGSEYTDAGAWCYDQEDGTISMKGQGQQDHPLKIVRAGCIGLVSGKPETVFDGDWGTGKDPVTSLAIFMDATKKGGVCPSCVTARLLWLDLGVSRNVKTITLKTLFFPSDAEVYVGDVVPGSEVMPYLKPEEATLCASNAQGGTQLVDHEFVCKTHMVGRIVTIKSKSPLDGSPDEEFTVCEAMIEGRPGPTAPPELEVIAVPTAYTLDRSVQADGNIKCEDNKFGGVNFCSQWCNTLGLGAPNWGCGTVTLSASAPENTGATDYTCSCAGCNGCEADGMDVVLGGCDGPGGQACSWSQHPGEYSVGYAGGVSTRFSSIIEAKRKCIELQQSTCKAITCYPGSGCTVRASSTLRSSPHGETTYVPDAVCFEAPMFVLSCVTGLGYDSPTSCEDHGGVNAPPTVFSLEYCVNWCLSQDECVMFQYTTTGICTFHYGFDDNGGPGCVSKGISCGGAQASLKCAFKQGTCASLTGTYRARNVRPSDGIVYERFRAETGTWQADTMRRTRETITDEIWGLYNSADERVAESVGLGLYPPRLAWNAIGSPSGCTVTVQFKPEDMCTWQFQYYDGADNEVMCADGTVVNGGTQCGGCCDGRGGIKLCSSNNQYMCEEKCGTDYCCRGSAASCAQGLRQCKQAQLNSTLDADLSDTSAIGPRIETVMTVDTDVIGESKVFYTCVDSMGMISVAARTVVVGCEVPGGPNILYSGNNLDCDANHSNLGTPTGQASFEDCAAECLADPICEGYIYIAASQCQKKNQCNGKYLTNNENQVAAVCRRKDRPPTVVLSDADTSANVGGSGWINQGTCTCVDLEDNTPPTCVSDDAYSLSTPGVYTITYTCTDSANNVNTAVRQLIVKAACDAPIGCDAISPVLGCVDEANSLGFCRISAGANKAYSSSYTATIERGSSCYSTCDGAAQPNYPELFCTHSSDDSYTSYWSTSLGGTPADDPKCGSSTCTEPTVSNIKVAGDGFKLTCLETANNRNARPSEPNTISEHSVCTPNCLDGYMPDIVGVLTCLGGKFEPVVIFGCYKRSTPITSLVSGTQGYLTMAISWSPGTAHSCDYAGWEIQGRRVQGEKGVAGDTNIIEHDWHQLPGCSPVDTNDAPNAVDRDTTECLAGKSLYIADTLFEGGTYTLRARESCTMTMLASEWYESGQFYTLSYVFPPEVLLQSPTGTGLNGVLSSPGQIVLAISVPVEQGEVGGGRVHLEREGGSFCAFDEFITLPENVIDGQPENEQVGLINGRIFLVLPKLGFFEPGCDYKMTFEAGAMRTIKSADSPNMPQKGNPEMQWSFTYIDERPVISTQFREKQEITPTGIKTRIGISYHLSSLITCRITKAGATGGTPLDKTGIDQLADGYVVYFEVQDQMPNTAFEMDCGPCSDCVTGPGGCDKNIDCQDCTTCGTHKANKVHVKVESSAIFEYTTMKDDNVEMNPMKIEKFAICPDNTERLVVTENYKTENQLALGEVLLIRSYEKVCNNNDVLQPGETAEMKIKMTVTAWSDFGSIDWLRSDGYGKDGITFNFQKPGGSAPSDDGNSSSMLKQTAVFYVCSNAHYAEPNVYPCKKMEMVVVCVDLLLAIENPASGGIMRLDGSPVFPVRLLASNDEAQTYPSSRRLQTHVLGPGPTAESMHLTVDSGTGMIIKIETSESVIDWDFVRICLGSCSDGYLQDYTYDPITNKVTLPYLQGVGVYLPLIFDFQNVQFDMKLYISFRTPQFVVYSPWHVGLPDERSFPAPLTGSAVVEVEFTKGMQFSKPEIAAAATPELYVQLKVVKEGFDFQFCGGTQFKAGFAGRVAECTIGPTISSPLVVKVLLKDYNTGDFWVSSEFEVKNVVRFESPGLTSLQSLDKDKLPQTGTARLDVAAVHEDTGATLEQELNVGGNNFPKLSEVSKQDAVLLDYQLYMLPEPGSIIPASDQQAEYAAPEIPVCKTLKQQSTGLLLCVVNDCLDVRFLRLQPQLVLQLGDLRSEARPNLLQLPRPVVVDFGPTETLDVGVFDFTFTGFTFGIPCATTPVNDQFCQNACQKWKDDGRPGSTAVQIFADVTLHVGDALCVNSFQNDTKLECKTSTSLRQQRAPVLEGETLGRVQLQLKAVINFITGLVLSPDRTMTVDTQLMQCQIGEQREKEDGPVCVKCFKGQYSHLASEQWPLLCSWCDSSSFNDQEGMTGCSQCPANTLSGLPPDSIERCTCISGYYSQYLDDFKIAGLPGRPCESCSSFDLTDEAPTGERCGQDIVQVDLCNVPTTHVCAKQEGSYDYRYCMMSCAGGMNWPTAKPGYFLSGQAKLSDTNETDQYKPVLVECDPPVSCSAGNVCGAGYAGFGCVECQAPPLKPYYREKMSNLCQPCGEGQIIGTVIMAAVGVFLSLGAFVGSLLYMKLLCDPVFKNQVDALVKEKVTKPIMRVVKSLGIADLNKRRQRVTFSKRDLLPARSWITKKDLGMVFRVSPEDRRVYVAGVRDNTPAMSAGIRANWRLVLINGENVKGLTEEEVKSQIATARVPICLTFRAPPAKDSAEISDEDAEAGATGGASTAASGMRMLTMSLGVAQSFKGIMSLEMEWPPFFQKVAYIVQNMLLNFDFFHPECSVAAPYWQKWLGFAVLPYGMFFPLFFSAACLKLFHAISSERYRKDLDFAHIQDWMLRNAMCRTTLITMLLFVNFHFTQLIQAFSCIEREPGVYVMTESQSTACVWADEVYRIVFVFSCFGWCVALAGFAFLLLNLYKGYYWQVGVDVRDELPWWMAMLEASTGAMKGYKEEVRTRIYTNIVAVKMFPVATELMAFRENLSTAINEVGQRSRRVKVDTAAEEAGQELEDTMDRRRDIIMAKDRFNESLKWSEDLEGNVLTYGWVLMVNTLARQLSLMLCVVFSAAFPPFGAAGQSLVFILNFLMIASNKPYMSDTLNFQEAMLVACMGALTFMATFKELLSQHRRAPDYPSTINACAMLIDGLVLCIVLVICSVMVLNMGILAMRAISMEDSSAMLNRVHYERIINFEKGEERVKGLIAKREVLEGRDQNFGNILLMDMKMLENQCKPQQWPQFRQGANALLHLLNQTLAQEKQDECPLNDDQMEAFGIRPTTTHLIRRRGSGIFTDILSKCLIESATKFAEINNEQNLKNAPFKGLASMLVGWIEKEVGEQRMRLKLKSNKARTRGQARKTAEQTIVKLIHRVVNQGERKQLRTLQEQIDSDEAQAAMEEENLWANLSGLLESEEGWDMFGPIMDAEWDEQFGYGNWWDEVPTSWDGTFGPEDYDYDWGEDYDYDHGLGPATNWDDLGPAGQGEAEDEPLLGPALYGDGFGTAETFVPAVPAKPQSRKSKRVLARKQSLAKGDSPRLAKGDSPREAPKGDSPREKKEKSTKSGAKKKEKTEGARHAVRQGSYVGNDFVDWGLEEPVPDLLGNPQPAGDDSFELGPGLDDLGPGLGDLGPGLDDLGPGLGDLGPGLDDLGPGLDDLGPGLDDLGPGLDDLGPGLDDIGPQWDDLGPGLDDLGPGLDDLGPGLDDIGPGLGDLGPNLDDDLDLSMLGPTAGSAPQTVGRSLPPLPSKAGLPPPPKADLRPKAKPLGKPKAKPLGKPAGNFS